MSLTSEGLEVDSSSDQNKDPDDGKADARSRPRESATPARCKLHSKNHERVAINGQNNELRLFIFDKRLT
jgi:hypothetical protein